MADAIPCVRDEPDSSHPDYYWHADLVDRNRKLLPGNYGRAGLGATRKTKDGLVSTLFTYSFSRKCVLALMDGGIETACGDG